MQNQKFIPGLLDKNIEFFVVENVVKAVHSGKVIDFTEFPLSVIELLKKEMRSSKEVLLALHEMHPFSEMDRVKQFAHCRLGGLDSQPDIENDILQDGEYWECPNRGKCPHEGILCKLPMFNGERLTPIDIELMQKSSSEKINEVIAEEMNMAMGTYHKFKRNLHKLLGVETKQGIAIISKELNII
jgi:hypothetical protein